MNEKFHKSIEKAGEEISLSSEQRARMRRTLHAYMEMKPLRASASVSAPTFGWFFTLRPVAAVLVFALFISSAGISYAAEGALPGDILYPVKTHVNEPVQGALALSASAKAEWAANVAGTRAQEAATLAAEGRLSTSTQQDLQENFEQHAQLAAEAIAATASSSPDTSAEAAVRFDAQLSEYQNVLAQIGTAKNVDVAALTSSIQNERGHIAAIRAQTESSDTDNSAAAGMGIAAKAQLTVSTKLAYALSESLSTSSIATVAAQLDDASTTISAGDTFTAKSALPDALGAFQNALTDTEKIGVFLNTSSAIHARTGLIVSEPQNQSAPRKTSRINKGNGNKNGDGEGSPSTPAAATTTTSSSATSSVTASKAATSSVSGNSEGATDTSQQTQVQTQPQSPPPAAPNIPSLPTLPISAPVHLGL